VAHGARELWTYRDPSWHGLDLEGFEVETRDGTAGKVQEADGGYVVVRTGPWVFRRTAVIPAAFVEHVDHGRQTLYVNLTRDEIRAAPEPDAVSDEDSLRSLLGDHYRALLGH
jgi:hypothetical protein